ncbi:hypothetical protein GQ53DRAFT_827325 [Thozetella sp. PMI_491]|nr:hypothetical protein GQ53DRAFT_827325 [Thozetella sp. PMI_491]
MRLRGFLRNGEASKRRALRKSVTPDYRPLPLRTPFVLFLFASICTILVLLEHARHVLPNLGNKLEAEGENHPLFPPKMTGKPRQLGQATLDDGLVRAVAVPTPAPTADPSPTPHPATWQYLDQGVQLTYTGWATATYTHSPGMKRVRVPDGSNVDNRCYVREISSTNGDKINGCPCLLSMKQIPGSLALDVMWKFFDIGCFERLHYERAMFDKVGETPPCWKQEEVSSTIFSSTTNIFPITKKIVGSLALYTAVEGLTNALGQHSTTTLSQYVSVYYAVDISDTRTEVHGPVVMATSTTTAVTKDGATLATTTTEVSISKTTTIPTNESTVGTPTSTTVPNSSQPYTGSSSTTSSSRETQQSASTTTDRDSVIPSNTLSSSFSTDISIVPLIPGSSTQDAPSTMTITTTGTTEQPTTITRASTLVTLTDSRGKALVTTMPVVIVVLGSSDSRDITTAPPSRASSVALDRQGTTIATITSKPVIMPGGLPIFPPFNITSSTSTIRNDSAFPTTDLGSLPSAAPPESDGDWVRPLMENDYFIGMFVPVLVSTVLAIMIQALSSAIRSSLPFRILTLGSENQVTARYSVCLGPEGFRTPLVDARILWHFREPLPLLSDILVLSSAVLTALSTSTIGLALFGPCSPLESYGCVLSLGYYTDITRAAKVLLAIMGTSVLLIYYRLHRQPSGLPSDPWSIGTLVSLALPPGFRGESSTGSLRDFLRSMPVPAKGEYIRLGHIMEQLNNRVFALGYTRGADGTQRYGIISQDLARYSKPGGKREVHELETLPAIRRALTAPTQKRMDAPYINISEEPHHDTAASAPPRRSLDSSGPNTGLENPRTRGESKGITLDISIAECTPVRSPSRPQTACENGGLRAAPLTPRPLSSTSEGRSYEPSIASTRRGAPSIVSQSPLLNGEHTPDLPQPASAPLSKQWGSRRVLNYLAQPPIQELMMRAVFFVALCGLLILTTYYDSVEMDAEVNTFERFMDSQGLGVRFLFTGAGVVITFWWDYFFFRIVMLNQYRRLSKRPQAVHTIFTPVPTNAFSGLVLASRNLDSFTASVAIATILSKFTPILLSSIPFHNLQTWKTHEITAWMTVSVLVYMVLVIFASFFVRWPYLPVEPTTIAGSLYYLCDSELFADLPRPGATAQGKNRTSGGARRIALGEMTGISGTTRFGIDYVKHRTGV